MNAHAQIIQAPSAQAVAALLEVDPRDRSIRVGDAIHRAGPGADAVADVAVFLYTRLHAANQAIFSADAILPDPEFQAAIVDAIVDPGMPVSAQPAGISDPEDVRIVDVERVRVAVPESQLESDDGWLSVRMPCSRPNLSPGFFMYVHEPDPDPSSRAVPGEATRYYVRHDDGDQALADWARCLERLTARRLAFRTKLLSRRSAYPRNDAIVFYAGRHSEEVREIVTAVGRPGAPGSPLCVDIGSGVSQAEDPRDPRPAYRGQSFGEHRCRLIAEAILDVLDRGQPLDEALTARCEVANVDPGDLARNRESAVAR